MGTLRSSTAHHPARLTGIAARERHPCRSIGLLIEQRRALDTTAGPERTIS